MSEKKNIIESLLTGDNLQKIVVVLVAVLGGGNIVQTKVSDNHVSAEMERAITEIHDLHQAFQEAMTRQKEINQTIKELKQGAPAPAPSQR